MQAHKSYAPKNVASKMESQMIFVYDSETTGFTQKGLPDDHASQPHLVQMACALYTPEGKRMSYASLIVKPEGWSIPKQASDVHGITTETALAYGIPLMTVMSVFVNMRHCAQEAVAHNKDFDDKVMAVQLARLKAKPSKGVPGKAVCTMTMATPILNLPPTDRMLAAGFNKPKSPTLTECVKYFFGEDLVGAHDAMVDVDACARILFEMRRREQASTLVDMDPVVAQERLLEAAGVAT